mmetsp:Transcript_53175/g.94929  ORF Transcript_53175/g.94929 Transcript_53175/m.94929 type:complete len:201 (+) Transcript_53175:6309-6911(+)
MDGKCTQHPVTPTETRVSIVLHLHRHVCHAVEMGIGIEIRRLEKSVHVLLTGLEQNVRPVAVNQATGDARHVHCAMFRLHQNGKQSLPGIDVVCMNGIQVNPVVLLDILDGGQDNHRVIIDRDGGQVDPKDVILRSICPEITIIPDLNPNPIRTKIVRVCSVLQILQQQVGLGWSDLGEQPFMIPAMQIGGDKRSCLRMR